MGARHSSIHNMERPTLFVGESRFIFSDDYRYIDLTEFSWDCGVDPRVLLSQPNVAAVIEHLASLGLLPYYDHDVRSYIRIELMELVVQIKGLKSLLVDFMLTHAKQLMDTEEHCIDHADDHCAVSAKVDLAAKHYHKLNSEPVKCANVDTVGWHWFRQDNERRKRRLARLVARCECDIASSTYRLLLSQLFLHATYNRRSSA